MSESVRYERVPQLDKRIANGDDFAGDAYVRWVAVGHSPNDPAYDAPAEGCKEKVQREYRYGLMNYKGGPNRIVSALLELVELKDIKDSLDDPMLTEYSRRKPLAWDEARGALTEFFAASASGAQQRVPDDVQWMARRYLETGEMGAERVAYDLAHAILLLADLDGTTRGKER